MAIIRQRTNADLESCVAVLKDVYAASGYPVQGTDQAIEFLDYPSLQQAWVAQADGQVVGNVAVAESSGKDISALLWRQLHPGEPTASLERLFVHPDRQGEGIATQLMETAIAWSKRTGIRLILYALVKDEGAIGMYRKLGWVEFGTQDFHYDDGKSMAAICFASPIAMNLPRSER